MGGCSNKYYKRLKHHPGLGFATLFSVLAFGAAATNKNIHSLAGVLILGGIGIIFLANADFQMRLVGIFFLLVDILLIAFTYFREQQQYQHHC